MIPYNKGELVAKLIEQMEGNSEMIAEAAQSSRQASIDSPGAMISRYDSGKEEHGYLADGLNVRQAEIARGASMVRSLRLPENPDKIVEGTLVRLSRNGQTEDYIILPYGGGEFIETEYGEVTVITPESPLASSMIGLGKGDSFSFEVRRIEREYEVVDIK